MSISTGKLAKMADGCAVTRMGDTSVMVTAVAGSKSSGTNFMPLLVDYRQKSAAAGRIPTNFLKRELGPTDKEILTSRLIDRSVRPLFPEGFSCETQLMCNLLAVDGVFDPDILSINAASAALSLSNIPWNGPVGAVRVGFVSNEIVINPTRKDLSQSALNLVVVATAHNLVVMLEGFAENILQQELLKGIKIGVKECQVIVQAIEKLRKQHGKPKKELDDKSCLVVPPDVIDCVKAASEVQLKKIFSNFQLDKLQRGTAVSDLKTSIVEKFQQEDTKTDLNILNEAFTQAVRSVLRGMILDDKIRCLKCHSFCPI